MFTKTIGSPEKWFKKVSDEHIELKLRQKEQELNIRRGIRRMILEQEEKKNKFMLREVLHKGLWKYKNEDFFQAPSSSSAKQGSLSKAGIRDSGENVH